MITLRKIGFLYLILVSGSSFCQNLNQYFDGADTNYAFGNSLRVKIDNSSGNIWQIGRPSKLIFDSAATLPRAIVTDTLNYYPNNNVSSFSYVIQPNWGLAILAIEWKQKLDMDKKFDGGIIEYSTDGNTWSNVFNNPYLYNFYGFDNNNKDTLTTGEYAFSGTDSTWKDIWMCFDGSFLQTFDSLIIRHTFKSDGVNSNKEGWIIDNLIVHATMVHTVAETEQLNYLQIYPTVTDRIVHIEAKKLKTFHIIESMQLINEDGVVVENYGVSPTKFFIDVSKHMDGMYLLKVNTNLASETFKIFINKS